MEITTVGLDLAKNVFQVHAIGSTGGVVVRRSPRRAQVIPFWRAEAGRLDRPPARLTASKERAPVA